MQIRMIYELGEKEVINPSGCFWLSSDGWEVLQYPWNHELRRCGLNVEWFESCSLLCIGMSVFELIQLVLYLLLLLLPRRVLHLGKGRDWTETGWPRSSYSFFWRSLKYSGLYAVSTAYQQPVTGDLLQGIHNILPRYEGGEFTVENEIRKNAIGGVLLPTRFA